MKWDELTNTIAKGVYRIEMADGFIPPEEADARWEQLIAQEKERGFGSGPYVEIRRYVGSALIVMNKMGLIDYD